MHYCHRCGAKSGETSSFCPQCGTSLVVASPRTVLPAPGNGQEPASAAMNTISVGHAPPTGQPGRPIAAVNPVAHGTTKIVFIAMAAALLIGIAGVTWWFAVPRSYDVTMTVSSLDDVTFRNCLPNVSGSGTAVDDALEISFHNGESQSDWFTAAGQWSAASGTTCRFVGTVAGPRTADKFSAQLTTTAGGQLVFLDRNRFDPSNGQITGRGDATKYERISGVLTLSDRITMLALTRCPGRFQSDGGVCGLFDVGPERDCRGTGRWDDISNQTFIRATLDDGTTVGEGQLDHGRFAGFEWGSPVSRGSGIYEGSCVFSFTIDVPRLTEGYVFDTADRGGISKTLSEMDDENWVLELSLESF